MSILLVRTVVTEHTAEWEIIQEREYGLRAFETGCDAVAYIREAMEADRERHAALSDQDRERMVLYRVPEKIDLWDGETVWVSRYEWNERELVSFRIDSLPFSRKKES